MFKHHRYPRVIILQAIYLKLRFSLSYRDVEELMEIRGVKVDHSTLQYWVFKFSILVENNMHKRKIKVGDSWRIRKSKAFEDQAIVPEPDVCESRRQKSLFVSSS